MRKIFTAILRKVTCPHRWRNLSTISYRLGRKLVFDPKTETFPCDADANKMLVRTYREPYVLPDKVRSEQALACPDWQANRLPHLDLVSR